MEPQIDNHDMPQWKKDLIARLRNQNKSLAGTPSPSEHHHQQQQHHHSPQQHHHSVREPAVPVSETGAVSRSNDVREVTCSSVKKFKMVQERVWIDMVSDTTYNNGRHADNSDSDSSEDLHYGPGIVKKLKNKYLSLALRESNNRPSILHMRKAASLENLLDEDEPVKENTENRLFESKLNGSEHKVTNRYNRKQVRGEMKRARSVEAISRIDNNTTSMITTNNRQSLHEDMLISTKQEGLETIFNKKTQDENETNSVLYNHRINKPKRLQPIMSETEKPPTDFVKQAKMIFEKRPEQRTKKPQPTGEVAAKVDSFNSIIVKAKVEAKVTKKPLVKHTKPVLNDNKIKINTRPVAKPVVVREEIVKYNHSRPVDLNKVPRKEATPSLPSPIPDVSRIDFHSKGENDNNLSETPDLILTSSPLSSNSPVHKKITTENFFKEEIRNSSPVLENKITSPLLSPNRIKPASPLLSPTYNRPVSPKIENITSPQFSPVKSKRSESPESNSLSSPTLKQDFSDQEDTKSDEPDTGYKVISTTSISNISKQSTSAVFNFTNKNVNQSHLPASKDNTNFKVPPSEPLQIDVSLNNHVEEKNSESLLQKSQKPRSRSPPRFSPPPPPKIEKIEQHLSSTEIEKNLLNAKKSETSVCFNVSVEVVNKNVVPKKLNPRELSSNTAVFNFTNRKDVPDYISNNKTWRASKPELPKPGEGGIIVLSPASLESFNDAEEELLLSLQGPPSPCDVAFINDNILIDGKSSFSQKTKTTKLKISFVEEGPDVYEYPSETSLLLEEESILSPLGHSVPNLGGSYLANYTPKTTESFQPGVTRVLQSNPPQKPDVTETDTASTLLLQEVDKPFSVGVNADILF